MKKVGPIIGLVIIVATLAFCATTFKRTMMAAVPFTEATHATDQTVQIMGTPVDGTMRYDNTRGALLFTMKDTQGTAMPVIFKGPKPEDLDTAMVKATKITAQGTYNPTQQAFVAENLLVKCPSKYQGQDGSERSYGKA